MTQLTLTCQRDQWYRLAGMILHGYFNDANGAGILCDERPGHEGENAFEVCANSKGELWHADISWYGCAVAGGELTHLFTRRCLSEWTVADLIPIDPPAWAKPMPVDTLG